MTYPPYRHPPGQTLYLDAICAGAGGLLVAIVAAVAHRTDWMAGALAVVAVAAVVIGWLENR